MLSLLKRIIGTANNSTVDLKKLYADGAVIVDVRTSEEYREGHIKGAINVPLQVIKKELGTLKKKNKPVITCCLSGGRSLAAKNLLAENGIEVYNGGGWKNLQAKLNG